MISEKLANLLEKQLEPELAASLGYLAMASWAEERNLPDIAAYFYLSSQDEREHFEAFFKYINEYSGSPAKVPVIGPVRTDFANILELFEYELTLEAANTENIRNLTTVAMEEHEYAVFHFLGPFNQEQLEAVKEASDLVHYIKILGSDVRNAWFFNKYMRKVVSKKQARRHVATAGTTNMPSSPDR